MGGMRMTDIKSAIESLDDCIKNQPCECEDFKLAIRSLQAWSEVLEELEEERGYLGNTLYQRKAYEDAIDIINQKLAEIGEGERYE